MSLVSRFSKTPVATTATATVRGRTTTNPSATAKRLQDAVRTSSSITFVPPQVVKKDSFHELNGTRENNNNNNNNNNNINININGGGGKPQHTSVSSVVVGCRSLHTTTQHSSSTSVQQHSSTTTSPLLMLEGDSFEISNDGVSKTCYKLQNNHTLNGTSILNRGGNDFVVEEQYNIQNAMKKFVLRQQSSSSPSSFAEQTMFHTNKKEKTKNMVRLGHSLFSFQLKEIKEGVLNSSGTGSMTWESSIAMALFFSKNPHLLRGHVIELGSGVGLGGILTKLTCQFASDKHDPVTSDFSSFNATRRKMTLCAESITFTDNSPDVLEQCLENIQCANIPKLHQHDVATNVTNLDWYDFFPPDSPPQNNPCNTDTNQKSNPILAHNNYDTVIASDCAYLHQHVKPLAEAISQLLGQNEKNQLHLFGPYNRAALHELIHELKHEKKMVVSVDTINLERYRLKSQSCGVKVHDILEPFSSFGQNSSCFETEEVDECECASFKTAQFLHVTATFCGKSLKDFETNVAANSSMSGID